MSLTNLREFSFAAVVLRLLLAGLFGGTLGYNRAKKRRPAGFRTYIIVCTAATLTMLLGQYEAVLLAGPWAGMAQQVGVQTDVSRFGAQVINGIGFLAAGTILITDRMEAKGLTTAAGLWASACMGLAIGAGFYECVLLSFVLIFLSICALPSLESLIMDHARNLNLYIEFSSLKDLQSITARIRAQGATLLDIELCRPREDSLHRPGAVFCIRLQPHQNHAELIASLMDLNTIVTIEQT